MKIRESIPFLGEIHYPRFLLSALYIGSTSYTLTAFSRDIFSGSIS